MTIFRPGPPRPPHPIRLSFFDRHVEHAADPDLPLCPHADEVVVWDGDTVRVSDGMGFGPALDFSYNQARGELVVVVNHLEYRIARDALARISK